MFFYNAILARMIQDQWDTQDEFYQLNQFEGESFKATMWNTLVYQFVQTGVGLENEGRFLALPRVCDGLPWVSYATKTNFWDT